MVKMENILCAVDFSETSDHASQYACSLAEAYGSRLTLFHVVEMPSLASYPTLLGGEVGRESEEYGGPELRSSSVDMEAIKQAGRDRLEELQTKCADGDYAVNGEIAVGDPFAELMSKVETGEFDLLVLGAHGQTGLKRLIIGSVAEKLVRSAPCPVLSVKLPQD